MIAEFIVPIIFKITVNLTCVASRKFSRFSTEANFRCNEGTSEGFPRFQPIKINHFQPCSIFPVLGTVYFCLPNQLLLRICTNLFCTANSKANSKLCKPPFLPVTGQILFSGHLKANLTTALTLYGSLFFQAIGRTLLPPYWSLGFQLSRWGYNKIETVKSLVENMRKYNLPQVCVVFVIAILATTNL